MYTQQTWVDDPNDTTPLSAARLTHMEQGIGAAVTVVESPAGDPGAAVWTRNLAATISTAWHNLREVYVNSVLRSYLNEWGALRGTTPYTSGDALVRAITDDTVNLAGGAAGSSAVEVVDRRTGVTGSPTLMGIGWDGKLYIGGTAAVPRGTAVGQCVVVNNGVAAPAGLPDGTVIVELA